MIFLVLESGLKLLQTKSSLDLIFAFLPKPFTPFCVFFKHFTAVLRRSEAGLGFSIAGGVGSTSFRPDDTGIFVSKVVEGGQADEIGKIQVGDKILSVSSEFLYCTFRTVPVPRINLVMLLL